MREDTEGGFRFEMKKQYLEHAEEYHILLGGNEYNLSDFTIKDPHTGDHDTDDGVIIMSGKGIRTHTELNYYASFTI